MPTPYDREHNNRFVSPDQMSDDDIWDLLSIYADGEATPDEVAQVEMLLEQQPALSREMAFLRHTSDAVQRVAEVEPPLHLRSAILAATVYRPTFARRVGMALERLHGALTPRPARFALAGGLCAAGLAALLLLPHQHEAVRQSSVENSRTAVVASNTPTVTPNEAVTHTPPPTVQPVHPQPTVAPAKSQLRLLVKNGLQSDAMSADKRVAQFTVNLDRNTVQSLLTASATPASSHTRAPGEARLQTAVVVKTQRSASMEHLASNETSGQFSPVPRMDLAYQRGLTMPVVKTADDTLGANIDGSHDGAAEQPTPAAATAQDTGDRRIIRVTLAQLPPDARHYVTTADIKREIDARNLGMNRLAVKDIERSRCDVPLARLKFN
jgi:hypothetical protein